MMLVLLILVMMMVMMLVLLILVMVMVVMLMFFLVGGHLCQLLRQRAAMLHRRHKLFAGKVFPGSGNNLCVRVEFFQHLNRSHQLFLLDPGGAAEGNHICILNLIIEEFSEIANVHLALGGVNDRYLCSHLSVVGNTGDCLSNIR